MMARPRNTREKRRAASGRQERNASRCEPWVWCNERFMAPRGEVRGALLDDGRMICFPAHEAEGISGLLSPGAHLAVRGEGLATEFGTVIEAREFGASDDHLRPFKRKKPKHDRHAGANGDVLSWVHFGDLHITGENEPNYQDFLALIDKVNANLADQIDFAVLPGDNADDGTEEQFRLVKHAVDALRAPLHILTGDHDRKPGSLDALYKVLGAEQLPKAITVSGHRCLFLDIVSAGTGGPDFRLGADQILWLERELSAAERADLPSVVFMHAYPADLREDAEQVRDLFTRYGVLAVDMGHTHYNELTNDGHTIYATTRSTGQIEEGPVGLSVAAIDGGVVSWRFKPLNAAWPLVLITSPADRRLVTNPEAADQVTHGHFDVRALAWSGQGIVACSCRIDDGPWLAMSRVPGTRYWQYACGAPDRDFALTVRSSDAAGNSDADTIHVAGSSYHAPQRRADGSDADAIGAWPEKHISGGQLGPNRNGRKW